MRWKKIAVTLIGIVLIFSAYAVVALTTDHENLSEQRFLIEELVVENLEVNGEDELSVIHENESVTVTATITNEGDDTIDVPLAIEWDDEVDDPHKGTIYEDLAPGETEDIQWTREEHRTWWPDNFLIRVGEETVNVIVVEDLNIIVEDLEVNGESEHLDVGEGDPITVTATVTNEGDEPVDVPLNIAWDYELDRGHKGTVLQDLAPGETDDIDWTREEHSTWWPDEYTVIVGTESVRVTVLEDIDVDIVVEDLMVNGEPDEVEIGLDEEVVITATVRNEGDSTETVDLIVEGAQDEEGHFGHTLELDPGDSEEIEWVMDQHATWDEGFYTIRLGDESVEVTVGEPTDEPIDDEVDWDEIRIVVGLIIAALVVGIGIGVLWSKKG